MVFEKDVLQNSHGMSISMVDVACDKIAAYYYDAIDKSRSIIDDSVGRINDFMAYDIDIDFPEALTHVQNLTTKNTMVFYPYMKGEDQIFDPAPFVQNEFFIYRQHTIIELMSGALALSLTLPERAHDVYSYAEQSPLLVNYNVGLWRLGMALYVISKYMDKSGSAYYSDPDTGVVISDITRRYVTNQQRTKKEFQCSFKCNGVMSNFKLPINTVEATTQSYLYVGSYGEAFDDSFNGVLADPYSEAWSALTLYSVIENVSQQLAVSNVMAILAGYAKTGSLSIQTLYNTCRSYLDSGFESVREVYDYLAPQIPTTGLSLRAGLTLFKNIHDKITKVVTASNADSIFDASDAVTYSLRWSYVTNLWEVAVSVISAVVPLIITYFNVFAGFIVYAISSLIGPIINAIMNNTGSVSSINDVDGVALFPLPLLSGNRIITNAEYLSAGSETLRKLLRRDSFILKTPWCYIFAEKLGFNRDANPDVYCFLKYSIYATNNWGWMLRSQSPFLQNNNFINYDNGAYTTPHTSTFLLQQNQLINGTGIIYETVVPAGASFFKRDLSVSADYFLRYYSNVLNGTADVSKYTSWLYAQSGGLPDGYDQYPRAQWAISGGVEYADPVESMNFYGSRIGLAMATSFLLSMARSLSPAGTVEDIDADLYPLLVTKNVGSQFGSSTLDSIYAVVDTGHNRWDTLITDYNTTITNLSSLYGAPSHKDYLLNLLSAVYSYCDDPLFGEVSDSTIARVCYVTDCVSSTSFLMNIPSHSGKASINTVLIMTGIAAAAAAATVATVALKKGLNKFMMKKYQAVAHAYDVAGKDTTKESVSAAYKQAKSYNRWANVLGYATVDPINGWIGSTNTATTGGVISGVLGSVLEKGESIQSQGVTVDLTPVTSLITG